MATDRTLRDVATEREFHVGAAIDPGQLRNDPNYWKTAKNEFNAITTESALKMGPLRPSPDTYDFGDADAIVEFGTEYGMYVRGHALVWHNQKPDWLQEWTYTDEQLERFLRRHIHTVAGRYRGEIDAWDVVNEGISSDGTLRETVWSNAIGEDYIDRAFEWAAAVTDADLYYNDYGADTINEKSDAIYDHLEGMLGRGVPIDGVGFQLHAIGEQPDPDAIAANLRRFSDLGLDVQLTEMDVAYDVDDAPAEPLEAQAEYYADVVTACLEAGCDTLVTWGINDSNSWVRGFDNVEERYTTDPLLFDRKTNPKPAYHAVKETLAGSSGDVDGDRSDAPSP